jgi:type VI protein secretion system component VasF
MTGLNPLNASAATLFALVSRIRNRAQHADPDALRRSVVAEIGLRAAPCDRSRTAGEARFTIFPSATWCSRPRQRSV